MQATQAATSGVTEVSSQVSPLWSSISFLHLPICLILLNFIDSLDFSGLVRFFCSTTRMVKFSNFIYFYAVQDMVSFPILYDLSVLRNQAFFFFFFPLWWLCNHWPIISVCREVLVFLLRFCCSILELIDQMTDG